MSTVDQKIIATRFAKPIAVAVVECRGRFLVGQRPANVALAGLAEFPGGKVEPGESVEQAAVRECFEEANVNVIAVERWPTALQDYAHDRVELHFIHCRLASEPAGELPAPRDPFRWVPRGELGQLEFPAANRDVLERIRSSGEVGRRE